MSYRTTLALLMLLVILGGAVYFLELRPERKVEIAKPTQIIAINPSDVTGIRVTYEGKTTELRNDGAGKWRIAQPEQAEADASRVGSLAYRLAQLNATRVLTGGVGGPAAYGLNNPKTQFSLDTPAGRATFQIGDRTPDGNGVYAKLDGADTIYVLPTSTISDVIKLVTEPPKALPTPTAQPLRVETPAPVMTPSGS